jgi:hypothetical protein
LFAPIIDFLDRHDISYWLDQGSLLGALREGVFFDWDGDIDLSVTREAIAPHLAALVLAFRQAGYIVLEGKPSIKILPIRRGSVRSVDLRIYDKTDNHWETCIRTKKNIRGSLSSIAFKAVLLTLISLLHVPFQIPIGNRGWFRFTRGFLHKFSEKLSYLKPHTITLQLEAPYLDGCERMVLYGKQVRLPANSIQYIEKKFGSNWRSPNKNWRFWRDDGMLV